MSKDIGFHAIIFMNGLKAVDYGAFRVNYNDKYFECTFDEQKSSKKKILENAIKCLKCLEDIERKHENQLREFLESKEIIYFKDLINYFDIFEKQCLQKNIPIAKIKKLKKKSKSSVNTKNFFSNFITKRVKEKDDKKCLKDSSDLDVNTEFIKKLEKINAYLKKKIKTILLDRDGKLEIKLRREFLRAYIHQKKQKSLDISFELIDDIERLNVLKIKRDILCREIRVPTLVKIGTYSKKNVSASTFIGETRKNQDCFLIAEKASVEFYAVFDGHGSYDEEASEFAARNTVHCFFEELKKNCRYNKKIKDRVIVKSLTHVFERIEKKFSKEKRNKNVYNGSTACLAVVFKNNEKKKVFIANVGDSRACFWSKDGKVIQLTKDQKGDCKLMEGSVQINCKRAIGIYGFNNDGKSAKARVTFLKIPEKEKGSYLIIGSDGLFDYFPSDQVGEVMKEMIKRGFSLKQMTNNLISCSSQAWKRAEVLADNITALIVKL